MNIISEGHCPFSFYARNKLSSERSCAREKANKIRSVPDLHPKVFALRVDETTISEALLRPGIVAGDKVTPRMQEAVRVAMFFTKKLQWSPVEQKILSPELYVSPIRIVEQGGYADAADLMVIHPERQIVYFVAAKM